MFNDHHDGSLSFRIATEVDIPEMVEVLSTAFVTAPLQIAVGFKLEEMRERMLQNCQTFIADGLTMVCEVVIEDITCGSNMTKKIVGVSLVKDVTTPFADVASSPILSEATKRRMNCVTPLLEQVRDGLLHLYPMLNHPETLKPWTFVEWFLLATSPEFSKQGISSKLAKFHLQYLNENTTFQVHFSETVSEFSYKIFEKLGFEEKGIQSYEALSQTNSKFSKCVETGHKGIRLMVLTRG